MTGRAVSAVRAVALGVIIVPVVVVTLGQAPAQAASAVLVDARGDMIRIREGAIQGTAARGATIADFTWTRFRHKDHVVVVRAHFVQLAREGRRLTLWVNMRTDTGRYVTVGVQAGRADWSGHTIFQAGRGDTCDLRHRIDYAANTIRVTVPRRCLDRPRTVAFRVYSEHVRRSWDYAWLDNGLHQDMDDRSWTPALRRG